MTLHPDLARPGDLKSGDALGVKVMAIVGGSGRDWAAYQAPTDWSDRQVLEEGNKIPQNAAEQLFPVMVRAGLIYRH